MTDLDLSDLLDPDLTDDQINTALTARLGIPRCTSCGTATSSAP